MTLVLNLLRNLLRVIFLPITYVLRRVPRQAAVHVTLDGAFTEVGTPGLPWRRERGHSLTGLRATLASAARDPRVDRAFITLRHFGAGFATAQALRALLLDFKRSGKELAVFLPDGGGNREIYIASAGTRVLLGSGASIGPLGFASSHSYLAPLLAKVGATPEVFARGDYKTAGEGLTRDSMSPAQREQLGEILDATYSELIQALSTSRQVPLEQARTWVERGLWSGRGGVSARLVDATGHEDEFLPDAERRRVLSDRVYDKRTKPLLLPLRAARAIAVVEVRGVISSRQVGPAPMAVESKVRAALRRAREDSRYAAVVVVINSRGGSAIASERMTRELARTAEKKPVVAYMADVAASGGYMIASAAHCIVAEPLTITGSIGVVSARLVVARLMDRIGVRRETVQRGAHAGMFSPFHALSESEAAALREHLDELYDEFLGLVAAGRKRPLADILPVAGGRVWTGAAAHQRGLVDVLGGFEEALGEARARAGTPNLMPKLVGHRRMGGASALLGAGASAALVASGVATPYTDLLEGFLPAELKDAARLAVSDPRELAWTWSDHAV